MRRPAKKRDMEKYIRASITSDTLKKPNSDMPRDRNSHIRARSCSENRFVWAHTRYPYVQYWTAVAIIPHIRLRTKLRDQSEFTQIAYLGGEKVGGLAKREVLDA
jgi:hypothetical protein